MAQIMVKDAISQELLDMRNPLVTRSLEFLERQPEDR
jgi:hypothetical protein